MATFQDVRVAVGKQLGIAETDAINTQNLSDEDRTRLLDYSFAWVAEHPDGFSADQVTIAKNHVAAWGVNAPLLDASFDWGELASEVGNNVVELGESVAGVGEGTMSLLRMAKWLIPLVAVLWIGIQLWKTSKR